MVCMLRGGVAERQRNSPSQEREKVDFERTCKYRMIVALIRMMHKIIKLADDLKFILD